ncbi:MAG: hypothetical protein IT577_12080 [Verrucomicrobiae bacterium]|nr:hypothetical protein [Verrucomicrobiae bacterium]
MVPVTSHRIAVFCDVGSPMARTLLRGLVSALGARSDARIVALCPYRARGSWAEWGDWVGTGLLRAAQRAIDPALPWYRWGPAPIGLARFARRTGCEIVTPDWTAPGIDAMARRLSSLGATAAMSFYMPRKLPQSLLCVFRSAINYHNGEVPRYRGMRTTHWAAYLREPTSGWTVHHMTDALDAGNVLAAGAVPIGERSGMAEIEHAKAAQAVGQLPQLLDRWLGGDPGEPQRGEARLFTRADYEAITHVENPGRLTSGEWLWRIRCFARVWARVGGVAWPVTRLVPTERIDGGTVGWRCADGVCLRVTRAEFLPVGVYRVVQRLTRKFP